LCTLLIWSPTVDGIKLLQRLNYGTVFVKESPIQATTEHWQHTFVLDYFHPNLNVLNISTTGEENVKDINNLYGDLSKYVQDIVSHIQNLIPNHKPGNRKRRSLLPFVGKIGKGLFGLATSDDVQNVANHVNKLIRNIYNLERGFKGDNNVLQSFINHTDKRINNVFEAIKENHDTISELSYNVRHNYTIFKQQEMLYFHALTKLITYNNLLSNTYSNLLQGCIKS
jgi:hypothetical protein